MKKSKTIKVFSLTAEEITSYQHHKLICQSLNNALQHLRHLVTVAKLRSK